MKNVYQYLMMTMLFVMLLVSPAMAENPEPMVVAGENGNACLFTIDGETYLVGAVDREAILAQSPEVQVDYVVLICDHPEHIAAAEAFGAIVIQPSQTHEGLIWRDGALQIGDIAFSMTEPLDGCLTMDCQGHFLTFEARTNTASVNVRATPTTKGKRVEKLSRGAVVTVVGQTVNDAGETWFKVLLENGDEGYVRADLLTAGDAVAATPTPVPAKDEKDTRYVGNKNSRVFHRPGCEHLPKGRNAVYFSSRSYAIAKGYRPCEHCDP